MHCPGINTVPEPKRMRTGKECENRQKDGPRKCMLRDILNIDCAGIAGQIRLLRAMKCANSLIFSCES